MPLKTVCLLLQILILSAVFSVVNAQDTVKTKQRPAIGAKPKPAQTSPVNTNPVQLPKVQVTPQPSVSTDKSLSGQYQFIIGKLYRYQQPMIDEFYKSAQDTLRIQRNNIATLKNQLSTQVKNVTNLKNNVNEKDENLNNVNTQINSINFLGMPITKTTYNLIMWGLVIILGALAATVIFLSGSARREANYRTKLYNELEEDYKGYKTKANDKEKKLSRELQTVRNKLEDITGNPEY